MDPNDQEQVMIQQDLIGFFNSVPRLGFCSALQLMICRLQEHFGQPAESLAFQVDHKTGARGQRPVNFQGTAKIPRIQHQGAADPTCYGADRVLVAICVLQSRAGHLLSDTRGLRGITVGTCSLCIGRSRTGISEDPELTYPPCRCRFATQFQVRGQPMLFLAPFRTPDRLGKITFQLEFYGLPIELEHVPGEELLGSITSTQQGTITMQQPANETTLRSLCSAGSKSAALSGFSARALSIKRHTRPIRLVRPHLIEIYRRRGFDQRELLQLASRFRV